VTLGLGLIYCAFRSLLARLSGPYTPERRARWNHESALLVMALLGIRLKVTGKPPERGLMVANHLSYLDILIFGAALPCYLVSKAEIGRWPFFGFMARAGGTLFVDRSSLASAQAVSGQIAERLKGTVPVLFFPEGTSTDGSQVLRFHSRFFTPAVVAGVPITTATVRYVPDDGSPERDLCWFGDAPFLPHLWNALGLAGFRAEVHFGEPQVYSDRRIAANVTHAEVEAVRAGRVLSLQ
jgi:1-acyl-sn-glycerol-3-phosphate acyltransferase